MASIGRVSVRSVRRRRGRRLSLSRNGQTERWSYNFDDTLSSSTDFSTRVTEYSYDSVGRQTAIDYTPLSSTGNDVTFSYTASDLLSSMVDPLGATTYGYDALNRALAVTSRADKRRRRARVDGDLIEV